MHIFVHGLETFVYKFMCTNAKCKLFTNLVYGLAGTRRWHTMYKSVFLLILLYYLLQMLKNYIGEMYAFTYVY